MSANAARKVISASGSTSGHGGDRRSTLSNDDKVFLGKLMHKYPKMRLPWYARFMSVVVGKPVTPGYLRWASNPGLLLRPSERRSFESLSRQHHL